MYHSLEVLSAKLTCPEATLLLAALWKVPSLKVPPEKLLPAPNQKFKVNCMDSTSNDIFITGVQLEVGSVATDFEHRSFNMELALAQRYFYRFASGAAKSLGLGVMFDSSQMFCAVNFPVTMRTTPSLSAASGTNYYEFIRNGGTDFFNSLDLGNRTSNTVGELFNATEISGTSGHGGFVRTDNGAVFVDFSAEI